MPLDRQTSTNYIDILQHWCCKIAGGNKLNHYDDLIKAKGDSLKY